MAASGEVEMVCEASTASQTTYAGSISFLKEYWNKLTMRLIDQHFQNPSLGPLYHYTGFGSLIGMHRSNSIWASSIHYMNDAMELVYAGEIVDELLAPQIAFGADGPQKNFAVALAHWVTQMKGDTSRNLFVFSLSEAASLLSQWRSYTPHGKGVSIGFPAMLIRHLRDSHGFRLGKCVYDKQSQMALVQDLFDKLWTTAQQQPFNGIPHAPVYPYTNFFDLYASDIYQVLSLIKHNAFSEEREWRLVSALHTDMANCEFREGASMLIPYVPLDFSAIEKPFDTILLGPTPHKDLSLAALWAFTSKASLCRAIDHCNIPYREW